MMFIQYTAVQSDPRVWFFVLFTWALSCSTEKLHTIQVSGSFSLLAMILRIADKYSTSLCDAGHTLCGREANQQVRKGYLSLTQHCADRQPPHLVSLVDNYGVIRQRLHDVEVFYSSWG